MWRWPPFRRAAWKIAGAVGRVYAWLSVGRRLAVVVLLVAAFLAVSGYYAVPEFPDLSLGQSIFLAILLFGLAGLSRKRRGA